MKNNKAVMAVVAIVLLGAGFGGGYAFAKSQSPMSGTFASNFPGGAAGGQFRTGTGMMGARGGNFIAGEILSKDASGLTIKMQDGSTKIILVGVSAQINKSALGTLADLSTGTNVTVTGTTNSDGSVTAQAIQIRPEGMGLGSTTPKQ